MSSPREGSRVSYCGDEVHGLAIGDRGKVLSAAGNASHVMWTTGSRAGEVVLTPNLDLVQGSNQPMTYDDLDSGTLVTISVRETYDHQGQVGLLNALNDEGHLSTFAAYAEEAISLVASRIREEPSFQEVLAALDPDEGAEFVSFAASILLRDAFGAEDA